VFSVGSQVARVAKTRRRTWKVCGSSSNTLNPPKSARAESKNS
jgi:hypothetical protein